MQTHPKHGFKKSLSFGDVLKKYRKKADLTQLEVSQRAGMSRGLLGFFEGNKQQPRREKVLRLAEALALSKEDREKLLMAAGFSSGSRRTSTAYIERTPLSQALEDLMNSPRLTQKQKVKAEQVLEVFVRWLQNQMEESKIKG